MKRGDLVKYRCLTGDVYDAEIAAVRQDGTIDIDVIASPHSRVPLGRIVMAEPGKAERGEAFPDQK